MTTTSVPFGDGASAVAARAGDAPRAGVREDDLARAVACADRHDGPGRSTPIIDSDSADRLAPRQRVDGAVDQRAAAQPITDRAADDRAAASTA